MWNLFYACSFCVLVANLKFALVLGLVCCAKFTRQADFSSDFIFCLGENETIYSEKLYLGVDCRVCSSGGKTVLALHWEMSDACCVVMISLCGPSLGAPAVRETLNYLPITTKTLNMRRIDQQLRFGLGFNIFEIYSFAWISCVFEDKDVLCFLSWFYNI